MEAAAAPHTAPLNPAVAEGAIAAAVREEGRRNRAASPPPAASGDEAPRERREAERGTRRGEGETVGGALVPRSQTALYTSQARRGVALYQDTSSFTFAPAVGGRGGIDLYA